MRTILVINSKGGAGKTTLTTNLAGYYASQNMRTAILDCDPQGSSMQWLRQRPSKNIHGATAAPTNSAAPLNSIKAWVPEQTEVLIIDAPAGVKGLMLKDLVRRANFILIPVNPFSRLSQFAASNATAMTTLNTATASRKRTRKLWAS